MWRANPGWVTLFGSRHVQRPLPDARWKEPRAADSGRNRAVPPCAHDTRPALPAGQSGACCLPAIDAAMPGDPGITAGNKPYQKGFGEFRFLRLWSRELWYEEKSSQKRSFMVRLGNETEARRALRQSLHEGQRTGYQEP